MMWSMWSRAAFGVLGVWLAVGLELASSPARAQSLSIIDAHAHINVVPEGVGRATAAGGGLADGVGGAVQRMETFGIGLTLLMAPPMTSTNRIIYDIRELRDAMGDRASRFRLLGGGGALNAMIHDTPADRVSDQDRARFRERAMAILNQGAVGFGEITAHHLSIRAMGPNHPYERVPVDHPLLLLLADIAAERDVPIDLHVDLAPEDLDLSDRPPIFNSSNPSRIKANQAEFERLLAHNPKARIVWAHAGTDPIGTRTPTIQQGLLERHPNLFMSLRLGRGGPPPFMALDEALRLKPIWRALLEAFPDRFVIGSDYFHGMAGGGSRGPDEQSLGNIRALLTQLPPELAQRIANGNARTIYRLVP